VAHSTRITEKVKKVLHIYLWPLYDGEHIKSLV
jgi:hypothetical protein